MEQAILENSKGATYMSFILDIEIVIKKDGAKVNVAETKAKSQVPKKKGADQPYAASRQQDVKVYAVPSMGPTRKSIFDFPLKPSQEDNPSNSDKYESPKKNLLPPTAVQHLSKTDNETREKSQDKENMPENKDLSGNVNLDENLDKTVGSDSGNLNVNKERPKKRKLSKAEKKQRVFKGKVEPIDFLECNRIFMCNYFKIPMSRKKRNTRAKNIFSDSNISIPAEDECSKVLSPIKQKSFSNQKLDSNLPKNQKLFRFWKNSSLKENTGLNLDYSLGDCVKTDEYFMANNSFELGNLNMLENDNTKSINNRKIYYCRRRPLISAFKIADVRSNSISKRESEKNNIYTQQSKSLNKLDGNRIFQSANCTSSDTTHIKKGKTYWKKHESPIKTLKDKFVLNATNTHESLIGLQINLNDDVEFVLAPQTSSENKSVSSKKSSAHNVSNLKRDNSQCKKISILPTESSTKLKVVGNTAQVGCSIQQQNVKEACKESQNSYPDLKAEFVSDQNLNVLNEDQVSRKFTTDNSEQFPSTKTEVLSDLQIKFSENPNLPAVHQGGIESESEKETYSLSSEKCCLKEKNFDILEREEFMKQIPNQQFETLAMSSFENHHNETVVHPFGVEFSQSIENQVIDKKGENQSGKSNSPSSSLVIKLSSYMTNFSNKCRKLKL